MCVCRWQWAAKWKLYEKLQQLATLAEAKNKKNGTKRADLKHTNTYTSPHAQSICMYVDCFFFCCCCYCCYYSFFYRTYEWQERNETKPMDERNKYYEYINTLAKIRAHTHSNKHASNIFSRSNVSAHSLSHSQAISSFLSRLLFPAIFLSHFSKSFSSNTHRETQPRTHEYK